MKETMRENKQEICNSLCATLQKTRDQRDLIALDYDDANGIVLASYEDGSEIVVNVRGDSGVAMIADIIREIVKF